MIIGIGNRMQDLRNVKGGSSAVPPPPTTFWMELENGSGFMQLEPSVDLMLVETAP
tara:strand:- start:223 stop:390 length:168 start_codon:yes stop_codon:yes gene_type:complete